MLKTKKFWIRIMWLVVSGFIYTFGVKEFISSVKIFSSGLTSIPQLITYITNIDIKWFSLIYFAFNIPFIIWLWFKLKKSKSFIIYTTIWLILQAIIAQLIYFIPILGTGNPLGIELNSTQPVYDQLQHLKWPVFIHAIIGSIFAGTGVGIAYKNGASSGGANFISYYYSHVKNKSAGWSLFVVSQVFILISITTQIALGNVKSTTTVGKIIGPTTISTYIYLIIVSWLINVIDPKTKKVEVKIYTKETLVINEEYATNISTSKDFVSFVIPKNKLKDFTKSAKKNYAGSNILITPVSKQFKIPELITLDS